MSGTHADDSDGGSGMHLQGMGAREFRRRLDEILRRRQPEAMRDFLLASGQWQPDHVPADLDRAMWMMIAASPVLAALHGEAERWLVSHGYEQEARTILGRAGGGERTGSRGSASGGERPAPGRSGGGTRQRRGGAPGRTPRTPRGGPQAPGGQTRPSAPRPSAPRPSAPRPSAPRGGSNTNEGRHGRTSQPTDQRPDRRPSRPDSSGR